VLKIKDKLPYLKAIIKTLPSEKEYEGIMSWKELEELNTDDYEEEYARRLSGIKANSCCGLIFTSGTTGKYDLKNL
jgi:long-subunit acyl-CoA synthetase (AMP-forming)